MSLLMQCFNLNRYPFMRYGPNVVEYYSLPSAERETFSVNPMCEAFPRIAACHYYRYGSGGRQETLDAICILGLNMINDKARINFRGLMPKSLRIIIFFLTSRFSWCFGSGMRSSQFSGWRGSFTDVCKCHLAGSGIAISNL